ncbi:MAG: ADP-ribose pyrophosphatase [Smithella sp. PtaU1.Bin162]|nr:MAG: ADP-ribose pyrophosphatase [Smithella sp. PtaU1.Bin162]
MQQNNSKLMYHCKIFEVWEEEVLFPNGKHAKQSRIDHLPTVAVIAVNAGKEIFLIKQYRNAVKKTLWEIPAGTLSSLEEPPLSCAQRELAEETGFQAGIFIPLFEGYLLPGYCNEYMYFFLAEDLFPAPLPPDEDEFIELHPTGIMQAKSLLASGKIIDAKTALGIILADNYLNKAQRVKTT